ncbi:MAG: carboxypeptidase-like regulatory domain-containing protein [Planctomycetaceae bacterium]|nr:carboxypeptidase-like regulatory domain-containing protein [Planctomycetaceae bacterium]
MTYLFMFNKNRIGYSLLLFLCLFFCFGCSSDSQLQGLVPVEGIVYFDGVPLADANIGFYPDNPENRTAAAKTDTSGKFFMTTLNSRDGVAPGEYKVTITKLSETTIKETNSKEEFMRESSKAKDDVKSLIPEKYGMFGHSGLTATVPQKGIKTLKFELTK